GSLICCSPAAGDVVPAKKSAAASNGAARYGAISGKRDPIFENGRHERIRRGPIAPEIYSAISLSHLLDLKPWGGGRRCLKPPAHAGRAPLACRTATGLSRTRPCNQGSIMVQRTGAKGPKARSMW